MPAGFFGHTLGPRVSFSLHCADCASAVCAPTHLPEATHHTHCGVSPPYIRQPSHVLKSLQPAQELKAAASPDKGHSLGPCPYQELHCWLACWHSTKSVLAAAYQAHKTAGRAGTAV